MREDFFESFFSIDRWMHFSYTKTQYKICRSNIDVLISYYLENHTQAIILTDIYIYIYIYIYIHIITLSNLKNDNILKYSYYLCSSKAYT